MTNESKFLTALALGRKDMAKELLEEEAPFLDTDELYAVKSALLLSDGKLAEARKLVEEGLSYSPNSLPLCKLGFETCKFLGESTEAEKYARKGLVLAPDDPTCKAHMAWVLYDQDQYPEAEELIREAMKQEPDSDDHKVLYALIRFALYGNDIEGHKALHKALEIDPTNTEALLIKEFLSFDDKEKITNLKKYLAAHPENETAQKRLKMVVATYSLDMFFAAAVTVSVMVATFFIPPQYLEAGKLLVTFLAPLLLLYFVEYYSVSIGLSFVWILFFDFAGKFYLPPHAEKFSVLEAAGHIIGAALLAYLLVKIFEYFRWKLEEAGWKTIRPPLSAIPLISRKILKTARVCDTNSVFFYFLTIFLLPAANLVAYLWFPSLLLPSIVISHLLVGWALSALPQFDDINHIVAATSVYFLATFVISLLVHLLLGNKILLFYLLIPGIYIGATVAKNSPTLIARIEEFEKIEAQLVSVQK